MDDIIQTHRASSPSSLLIVGVVILLALVAFASVAQADVKIFVVNTTDDPGNGVCNPDPG
ncbi:hypothetical protein HYR54_02175 [Candidatus Acetothermia bacterium]|nr:hypothetical protein [Candidatus Acetothermia bacterium]